MAESPPEKIASFRARYRTEVVPSGYSAALHVILVVAGAGGGLAAAIALAVARGASWRDAWIVPLTALVANLVEYLAHRGPMHHLRPGLAALHARHSGRHHRFFVAEAMPFEGPRDLHAVLFPPVLLLFFGAIAVGLGALVALFLPTAVAALFVASALGYYLLYELLHFLYHVPPNWAAARWPGVRTLARLHRRHHDPRCMQHVNFNLVFPLCDRLAGTFDAGTGEPAALMPGNPPGALR